VEGSLASSMDGIQIDKRSTLPESNKTNEEKKAIVVGGERERKEKEEKKKHEEIYLCNLRERERAGINFKSRLIYFIHRFETRPGLMG